jgi:hypothetical protein
MKQVHREFVQVDIVWRKKAVGPRVVEKGPVPRGSNIENIRVRRPVFASPPKLLEMDMRILAKLVDQKVSVGVVSNHAQTVQLEIAIKNREVAGNVERASTPTHRFGSNVGDGALGRVIVDDFDKIDDPIARASNTSTVIIYRIHIQNKILMDNGLRIETGIPVIPRTSNHFSKRTRIAGES